MLLLLSDNDVRDLSQQGGHGIGDGDADESEEGAKEDDLAHARVIDVAEADDGGDGEEEPEGCGGAGTACLGGIWSISLEISLESVGNGAWDLGVARLR